MSLPNGQSHQCMGDAFAHRPSDEGHVGRDADGVALSDHPAVLDHDHSSRSFWRQWIVFTKRAMENLVQRFSIDLRRLCAGRVATSGHGTARLRMGSFEAGTAWHSVAGGMGLPVDPLAATPCTVLNRLSADQSEQGTGFYAPTDLDRSWFGSIPLAAARSSRII